MKKVMVLVFSLVLFIPLYWVNSRPDFVPEGASWRIDIYLGAHNCIASWREVSHYNPGTGAEGGEWGQGRCDMPGMECHCYDWLTWWFGIAWVPDPPEGWESIFGQYGFPTYNPIIDEYEY